jgi:hypothetical protein
MPSIQRAFLVLFSFSSIGYSGLARADCLSSPAVRVAKSVNVPAGMGIKEIHLFHARDQNTFHTIMVCARGVPGAACENTQRLMQNREHFSFVPKSALIRTGAPGATVSYTLGVIWHEHGRQLLVPRIDQTETPAAHHEYYFTSCGDPYAATILDVIYSNSP